MQEALGASQAGSAFLPAGRPAPSRQRAQRGLPAGPYRVVDAPQREQGPATGRGLSAEPVAMISTGGLGCLPAGPG